MIGGVIMVHGDDDGLRVPPRVAPWQIVIVPMLRDAPEDAEIVSYCKALQADLSAHSALGEPVRALLDLKFGKPATKRWGWVKKGAPIVIEVGGRDVAGWQRVGDYAATVCTVRTASSTVPSLRVAISFATAAAMLEEIQASLLHEARVRLDANIVPCRRFCGGRGAFRDPGRPTRAGSKCNGRSPLA